MCTVCKRLSSNAQDSTRKTTRAPEYVAILGYSLKVASILEEFDHILPPGSLVYLVMGDCRETGEFPKALKNVTLQFVDGDATNVDTISSLMQVGRMLLFVSYTYTHRLHIVRKL